MTTIARILVLLGLGSVAACSAPDNPSGPPLAPAEPPPVRSTVPPQAVVRPAADTIDTPAIVDGTRGAKTGGEKRRYVVAAIGDSLTDPRSHGGKYLEYLAARCPESRFDSYGKGGNMVNQMRQRFVSEVFDPTDGSPAEGSQPDYTHVIVLGGINDILSDESALRTVEQIEGDLSFMYEAARKRGAQVIALTLPPWAGFAKWYNPRRGASTAAVNRWIKQQHRDQKVDLLLDIYPILSCGDPTFLCPEYGWPDQVHWSAAGHEVVGRALHEQVFSDCR